MRGRETGANLTVTPDLSTVRMAPHVVCCLLHICFTRVTFSLHFCMHAHRRYYNMTLTLMGAIGCMLFLCLTFSICIVYKATDTLRWSGEPKISQLRHLHQSCLFSVILFPSHPVSFSAYCYSLVVGGRCKSYAHYAVNQMRLSLCISAYRSYSTLCRCAIYDVTVVALI